MAMADTCCTEPRRKGLSAGGTIPEHGKEISGPGNSIALFWGGYRIKPDRFEFWQGRSHRLHDRMVYRRDQGQWKIMRLSLWNLQALTLAFCYAGHVNIACIYNSNTLEKLTMLEGSNDQK